MKLWKNFFHITALIAVIFLCQSMQEYEQPGQGDSKVITASDVIRRIQEGLGVQWRTETVDTYKTGDPEIPVSGIATTFMATYDVLKQASEKGINLIITHEPTFYNHADDTGWLKNDPVYEKKMKLIRENNMVIYRLHDHIHMAEPDGIIEGMVQELDWESKRVGGENLVFRFPETDLKSFSSELARHFGVSTLRVIGDPAMKFTHVGLVVGAPGANAHFKMLQRDDVQIVVIGESREWEAVEYARDAVDEKQQKAMIILGHALSEEGGMEYFAKQLGEWVPELEVTFLRAGNPFWNPVE